jgi:head-tail adaptor
MINHYDRVVAMQRAQSIDDGLGTVDGGWFNLLSDVPARFRPALGKERFANAQNAANAPAIYFVRYCPELADLSAKDRLIDCGIIVEILGVRWDGRTNSEIEISTTARGAQ